MVDGRAGERTVSSLRFLPVFWVANSSRETHGAGRRVDPNNSVSIFVASNLRLVTL